MKGPLVKQRGHAAGDSQRDRPVHTCRLWVPLGGGPTGGPETGLEASAAGPCASAELQWGRDFAETAPATLHCTVLQCSEGDSHARPLVWGHPASQLESVTHDVHCSDNVGMRFAGTAPTIRPAQSCSVSRETCMLRPPWQVQASGSILSTQF